MLEHCDSHATLPPCHYCNRRKTLYWALLIGPCRSGHVREGVIVESFLRATLRATLRLVDGTTTCINSSEAIDSEFWTELAIVCMRREWVTVLVQIARLVKVK